MPVVEIVDASGNRIKAEMVDGLLYPKGPFTDVIGDQLDFVRGLHVRDDDVMICSYPKCGTHWVWEMVQMLQSGSAQYDSRSKEALMLDFMTPETILAQPGPRTLNSHFRFRDLPAQVVQKKTKIILLNRDPRDVMVSYLNHFNGILDIATYRGSFSDFFPLFLQGAVPYGSWFDYVKEWEAVREDNPQLPILSLCYEDMKERPVQTVRELARFLGLPASEELCRAIAEACDFTRLKAAHNALKTDPLQFTWKDPKEHPGVYRKGQVGDWKNWFTVSQLEQFDAFYTKKMAGTKVFDKYATTSS